MLNFVIHNLGDTALLRCAGRLVSGDGECLRNAVLGQSRAQIIVLDLAEISSIDAAGIGLLVSLRTSAQSDNKSFKLMNLTPRVEEVLELTNLRAAFEVCSLREMLDLLCHAIRLSRLETPADVPGELTEREVAEDHRIANAAA